jgi:hypothetical protein
MLINKSNNSRIKIKRRSPRSKKHSRFLELAILAIFAIIVIYGASFALKITNGVSKTVDIPIYNIRLQILNGCGAHGAADKAAKLLPNLIKLPLEVSVVEVYDFKAYNVKKSFIISRESDMANARALAGQLGLAIDNIVFEPIDNNYRSISVTLVLGEDYETAFLNNKK